MNFFDNNLLVCRQAGRQEAYLTSIHKIIYTPCRDAVGSVCSFYDVWPETRRYKNIKYLYCHATEQQSRENTAKNYS